MKKKYKFHKGDIFNDDNRNEKELHSELKDGDLDLRFCHDNEIQRKHNIFLKFKAQFLQMIKQVQT